MIINKALIEEQEMIVNSNKKNIVVSAGPGSGKTYTIIRKAVRELKVLESKDIEKGLILCSFTREASLEIQKRLNKEINNDYSFVGTIDSFILTKIISPFKNRILEVLSEEYTSLDTALKIVIPDKNPKILVNILTKQGITPYNRDRVISYYYNWVNNLKNGVYEVSFAAYLFAGNAIDKVPSLSEYIRNQFLSIYIDEAQDLNFYQIRFLKRLVNKTNINCYLIGDKRQSIYSFRGAKPDLFYNMKNEGFTEFKITHSVRCHYNILEFSRRIVGESSDVILLDNDGIVEMDYDLEQNINYLKTIDNYFILVERNGEAISILEKLEIQNITNIIYSKRIELESNKLFSDNYFDVIEELLKFYYNHFNRIPKYTYSIEELILFLEPILDTTMLQVDDSFILKDESVMAFLEKIFTLCNIELPKEIYDELYKQLNEKIYINQYTRFDKVNRIMTVHSSKGLEADYVFISFTRRGFGVDDEYKRKLFVAFTRAKKQLLIGFNGNIYSPLEAYIKSVHKKTFK